MWHLFPGQSLRHRGWHDEFVVYNELSGDTHLLGADAMRVLLLLKAGPRHEHELADALFPYETGAECGALREMLDMLGAIALIEER